MAHITYRLATADGVDTMVHHRCAMFAEMGLGNEYTLSRMHTEFRQWALEHLANGTFWTWFACDGGKVVCGAGIYALDWPRDLQKIICRVPISTMSTLKPTIANRVLPET